MRKLCVISLLLLLGLFGCSSKTTPTATPTQRTSTPSATGTPESPTATITATVIATATQFVFGISALQNQTPGQDTAAVNVAPHSWTMIDKDKITLYSADAWWDDYAYEKNGGVWIVGAFGVIHKETSGKTTWYSMKNGLPVNYFRAVAISPKNEVWIVGFNNSILRFDGKAWVAEGAAFAGVPNIRNVPCDQREIVGIDFDENGAPWIVNAVFGLYTQKNGQWVNVPLGENIARQFPNERPCALGLRVKSEHEITIEIGTCCSTSPTAYHYDGKAWSRDEDYSAVTALLTARHTSPITGEAEPLIYDNHHYDTYKDQLSGIINPKTFLPPELGYPMRFESESVSRDRFWMAIDQNNVMWLHEEANDFYNNASGEFKLYPKNYNGEYAEQKDSALLSFGSEAWYFQDGKIPLNWRVVPGQAGLSAVFGNLGGIYPSIDSQNRFWFYHPVKGMAIANNGNINFLGAINPQLSDLVMRQVLPLRDGRVLIESAGVLWMLDGKNWEKWVLPDKNERFPYMSEGKDGMIYVSDNTGVYRIDPQSKHFTASIFGAEKPYQVVKLFHLEDDGTAYYVNNHIVARFDGKSWRSFLFDTVDIEAAAIDKDKALWIYTNGNGMLRLVPDAFAQ